MPVIVTPLYALPLAALFLLLSVRVIGQRKRLSVSLGDGGDGTLRDCIRAHGNCAEYAPMGLLLILIAELAGAPGWGLHLAGVSLVAGRLTHAWALAGGGAMAFRVAGMALTFIAIGLAAILTLA